MLICISCGHKADEFDDSWVRGTAKSYAGDKVIDEREIRMCPECGSEDIEEAGKCDYCGEYCDPYSLCLVNVPIDDDHEKVIFVCPSCYDEYYSEQE